MTIGVLPFSLVWKVEPKEKHMQNDYYITLLHKKLSGDISPPEREELSAWINASPDHQQIVQSVEKAWDLSGGFQREVVVDLDEDFAMLEEKMDTAVETPPAKVVAMPARRRWIWIAASIAVLLLAVFGLNNFRNQPVEWLTLTTTATETKEIVLSDGSKIWLNHNSSLEYPQEFQGQERNVKLRGEAFFEITKSATQTFSIHSASGKVTVLGTVFNVRDYEGEETMSVQVQSGKVRVENNKNSVSLILEKNEKGVYDKSSGEMNTISDSRLNDLAWHTRKLVFNNQPFSQVAEEISRMYNVRLIIESSELEVCPFSNTFNDKKLEVVLETITTVFGMEMEKQNDGTIRLKGGQCQ